MKKKHLALLLCAVVLLCSLLIACGESGKVKVTLTANNGTDATVEEVNRGEAYTLPTPTRAGYSFEGWFASEDFAGAALTAVTPTDDITVYAKWEKLYTLTLDAAGGTLSASTLSLKAGVNLKDAVKDLVPTKTDAQFGAWLLDGEELSDSAVMSAEDMTLTAKYKVKYTVEINLQKKTLDGYEKSENTVTGYAYAGESFTSKETVTGFKEVKQTGSVATLVISENVEDNLFVHYFDRVEYTLTYISNFPDGSQNRTKTEKLVYGVETDLPFVTFDMPGYYLEGWALTANGDAVYSSHVMDSRLFNAEAAEVEKITATANLSLYAVWSKGYTDLFGGSDVIYVSACEEETAYLYRGDVFFKGVIEDNKDLLFYDSNDDILYEGKINSDGLTFLYLEQSRSEVIATLYVMGQGKGLDENVKIYFDDANGITYSVKGEDGVTADSEGEYFFDGNGYMVATFKTGDLAGTTMTIIVGNISLNNVSTPAFQVRNEKEYGLGDLLFFTLVDGAIGVMTDSEGNPIGNLSLNGFGVAQYNRGGENVSYYYSYDEEAETITLLTSQGTTAGVIRLAELNGDHGYFLYSAEKDVSYTLEDGSVLSLDGMLTATYTVGETTVSGFFSEATSAFGGTILSFTEDKNNEYMFMITTKKQDIIVDPEDPTAGTKETTVTTVAKLSLAYGEYYYKNSEGTYYAPLFVFEGTDRTTVTVYGYTSARTHIKMAAGTMIYHPESESYIFTVTERFEAPDVLTTPIDFSKVKSCVMMLDKTATAYSINFWLNVTDTEDVLTDNTVTYLGENGEKIILAEGMVISVKGENVTVGTYKTSGSVTTLVFPDHSENVELNETEKVFTYVILPTTINEVGKDGKVLKDQYLHINSSEVSYNILWVDEEEHQQLTKYVGKLYRTEKTSLTGFQIYLFVSDDKDADEKPVFSMEFIQISTTTNQNYFFVYDEAYAGTFTSKNGILKLDGFGYAATYGDEDGLNVIGMYGKVENDVQINASGKIYNFLLDGETCALRGNEYGKTFLLLDNQVFRGLYVSLDGLGNATVFRVAVEDGESKQVFVDKNATYVLDGDDLVLHFTENTSESTLECKLGTYKGGTTIYNALLIKHEEVVTSYVNEKDWSVLVLNSDGTAVKYLKDGKAETGSFSLVTDSLLYYVNDSATEAFIYVYDKEAGTAIPQNYDVCAYYTKDLESLLFSKYGFAIFNNETRYYYTVVDGNVTIYHLDAEDPTASEYGYVAEDFGRFDDTKDYNGKKYYKNDGYAISFVREESTKGNFPVRVKDELYAATEALTFTPSGSETFSVSGALVVAGESYNCVVVRTVDELGVPSMYVRVGNFYFDIQINYQGDGSGSETVSTYEVIGLTYKNALISYNYLYYYYYIYSMMGASVANTFKNDFGTVEMVTEYDEDGKAVVEYLSGSFGKSAKFLEANGEYITALDHVDLQYLGSGSNGTAYYKADFVGDDGYTYHLYLGSTYVSVFRMYGFIVHALIREETVAANDGYEVTVNRVITSDAGYSVGAYYSFDLAKDSVELPSSNVMLNDNKLYYIVRETNEEGVILSTVYYQLDLVEDAEEIIGGGEGSESEEQKEEAKPLPVYKSATVTVINATTYMSADGKSFIDVLPENKVLLLSVDGASVLITESTYDEATHTFTLKTTDDSVYTVTVSEGVATIVFVPATEEND